jgi:TonB family protein
MYEVLRDRSAILVLQVGGEGQGTVSSIPEGIDCGADCFGKFEPGAEVTLVVTLGELSTFEGWGQAQHSLKGKRTELEGCVPNPDYYFECKITVPEGSTTLNLGFGVMPERVDVAFHDDHDHDHEEKREFEINLPTPEQEEALLAQPPTPLEELLTPEPEEVQPKVQPKKEEKLALAQKQPNMKSVEVPDENEVDKAPDDARFLSDKNRNVAEETHAKDTNLQKEQAGERAFSEQSDVKSEDVGAKETEIAELSDSEATDYEKDEPEEEMGGKDEIAKGAVPGDDGEDGDDGQEGDSKDGKKPGILAMRGLEGRGPPGGPVVSVEKEAQRRAAKRGKRGREGIRGISKPLDWQDFERISGKDRLEEEMRLAQKKRSKKRGKFDRKMAAMRSSLENFTPEVRPGNQTALKTRAAPFAVYIARMHRRIHKLWGFGFLEDLNDKSASNPMNKWSLNTKIEVVINPDGTIDKVTIVKPSGVGMFDVAALDVLYTAEPYEVPPQNIRSPNGKVYMHWNFYRDWRQCYTGGVHPFILAKAPKDEGSRSMDDQMVRSMRRKAAANNDKAAAATARALSNMPTPDDPKVQHVAGLWMTGFAHRDLARLKSVSAIPFSSSGTVVAKNKVELETMYKNLFAEAGRVRGFKVLSAAEYRSKVGALPKGNYQQADLFMVVRASKGRFTLVLRPRGKKYVVVALSRT